MNFQQIQHNEESDYEYDDERSLQTDDLSYLSSSYDTENEDENDDDISVKIGGNIIVDGEDNGEEEGEMELEGGKTKKTFNITTEPYLSLHNRHGFHDLMSYVLSDKTVKSAFVDYINTGTTKLGVIGTEQIASNTLNYILMNFLNTSMTPLRNDEKRLYFKSDNRLQELFDRMYNVPTSSEQQKPSLDSVINNLNNKVYLSNKFAIELMFCLTHFINDGCSDIKGTNVPNHQKFKRRYEYRELFTSFVKAYTENKGINSIKPLLNKHDDNNSIPKQQKIFMKYLLLLIAFESDNLAISSIPGQTSFVKRFTIPDPSNATEFIDMLKRIMNCFSISEDITPARNIIKQFYDYVNLIVNIQILTDDKLTVSQWINDHLLSTIEFYLNLSYIKKRDDNKDIEFTNGTLEYFKKLKQNMYDKSKLIKYLSDDVDVDEIQGKLKTKDTALFFLEYITGNKQASDTTGKYFYNHSLPIIPYASDTESSSMTPPASPVTSSSLTEKGVSEPSLLNGYE